MRIAESLKKQIFAEVNQGDEGGAEGMGHDAEDPDYKRQRAGDGKQFPISDCEFRKIKTAWLLVRVPGVIRNP